MIVVLNPGKHIRNMADYMNYLILKMKLKGYITDKSPASSLGACALAIKPVSNNFPSVEAVTDVLCAVALPISETLRYSEYFKYSYDCLKIKLSKQSEQE